MFWYSFGDKTSVAINTESIKPSFSIISISKPRLFSHHDSLISAAPLRLIESLNCLIFWSFGNDTIRLEFLSLTVAVLFPNSSEVSWTI